LAIDGAIHRLARELGLDPLDVVRKNLGPVDKLIGPEAGSGDVYEAEIAC
jgi:CO/xanthine dehydrogenase Mo-binding subunit